ncbi:MAG: beta-galactosidase, partial [Blastochloris sp.]|nr:beta-galactosidase [Blastochloris sp.]
CATKWWYEILKPEQGTEVLATWRTRHQSGQAAVTLRRLGKGAVLYVGTYFTPELLTLLQERLLGLSGLEKPFPKRPGGVEVVKRSAEGRVLWFFLNHGEEEAVVRDVVAGKDLLNGTEFPGGNLILKPQDVKVIRVDA